MEIEDYYANQTSFTFSPAATGMHAMNLAFANNLGSFFYNNASYVKASFSSPARSKSASIGLEVIVEEGLGNLSLVSETYVYTEPGMEGWIVTPDGGCGRVAYTFGLQRLAQPT